MRILMAGGGTGGHVMPLLAVAEELRRRGHEPHFVGTRKGFEAKLVPARGFPIDFIDIGGFQGKGLTQRGRLLWQLPQSILSSLSLLRRFGSKACFSLGGYVAAPPVLAALMRKIPLVVMEPNAMPGMVHRWVGRFATRAVLGFAAAAKYFPAGSTEVAGLPVREEFFQVSELARGPVFRILVTGGSQGSQTLNRAVRELWPLLATASFPVHVVHQCGNRAFAEMQAAWQSSGLASQLNYEVSPFLDDMPRAFAEADLIICRAGASTVGELMAAGRPSILVPFPFAADDHQARNAEAMVAAGASLMLRDQDCNGPRLFRFLEDLAPQNGAIERMAACARSLRHSGAASRAAEIVETVAAEAACNGRE
jgi:UDP-N-acetylglucosamine--N-acetylmuramyl-(pentapeptide) pyrophosphoryl-undecaprenol N-acetylglucosamine transferase